MYTLANELGFFSFRDLEPGTYVLTVTRIGFREHREQVSVEAGATDVEVVMTTEAIVVAGITVERSSAAAPRPASRSRPGSPSRRSRPPR